MRLRFLLGVWLFALSQIASATSDPENTDCVDSLQCLDVDGVSCDNLKNSCESYEIPFQGDYLPPPTVTPPPEDCRYLEISGLPPDDIQSTTMGIYERTEKINRGKPVYKQIAGPHYLFGFNPSLWVVGTKIGEDDGKVLVWDGAVEPRHIKAAWQSYNGKEWDFVSALGARCRDMYDIDWDEARQPRKHVTRSTTSTPAPNKIDVPCPQFKLVGQGNQDLHFGMMGTYAVQPQIELQHDRHVWSQISSAVGAELKGSSKIHHMFSIFNNGNIAWIIGETIGKDDAGLVVWDDAHHPKDITKVWKAWNTAEWEEDPRLRIECVADANATPTPTPPLLVGLCDRVTLYGLGPGDPHHFMMGPYSLHPEPCAGKVVFKQEDGDQFMFSMMDAKVWGVGTTLGLDDVGILVWDTANHPILIARDWQIWNGNKWVNQPRLKIKCDPASA